MTRPATDEARPGSAINVGAPEGDLRHIPGRDGWPLVGSTLHYLVDQEAWSRVQFERYGRYWRSNILFNWGVVFQSADAAEAILLDRDRNLSSLLGWGRSLGSFFSGGLMLRDFDDHKMHRRLLQSAFKRAAVEGYVTEMHRPVADAISRWPVEGAARFYPIIKALLLEQAATVFLGMPLGDDFERVREAFTAMVHGPLAVVPYAVPGLTRWRALRGREYLADFMRRAIPSRRASEAGDMFSRLCRDAADEDGSLSDDEVVDHMIFLLMAAHDTTTSALTTLVEALGRHPEWQQRLRDEALSVTTAQPGAAELDAMVLADQCLREAMRLYPPVPTLPRRTLRPCVIDGASLPANTAVWLDIYFIQRSPDHWTRPDAFDPERFSDARAEHKRHRFCWMPFGGGAHTCIGMQFASLQAKLVLFHLLRTRRWTLDDAREPRRRMVPFPKRVDDLPLRFSAV